MNPKFPSNQAALNHYENEVSKIETKTGKSFDTLWWEAENSTILSDEQELILDLARKVRMCKYLVANENKLKG